MLPRANTVRPYSLAQADNAAGGYRIRPYGNGMADALRNP